MTNLTTRTRDKSPTLTRDKSPTLNHYRPPCVVCGAGADIKQGSEPDEMLWCASCYLEKISGKITGIDDPAGFVYPKE